MKDDVTLEQIRQQARAYHNAKRTWHFHILAPNCVLNKDSRYVFMLECPGQQQVLVHHSNQAEKALGQELLALLHGNEVLQQATTSTTYQSSPEISAIIAKAEILNEQGVAWHHHMLFPGCQFNKHPSQFTLVLEDGQSGQMLESVTNDEPINDLKQIEPLFYKGKS